MIDRIKNILSKISHPKDISDANKSPEIKYTDVFVAGGFPSHTYNPRLSLNLEENLQQVHNNLCKLVTVTGHTKSGKTVLVEKIIPRKTSIWIDGGSIGEENEFWESILNQLNLYDTVVTGSETSISRDLSGSISVETGVILAKGGGSIENSIETSNSTSTTQSRTLSPRVTAIEGLRKKPTPLVIDDFHYLPKNLQEILIRALKPLIFAGLPVVIIAIPHHRYDVIKIEKEMSARIMQIQIPLWSEEELQFIPETGFNLLNVDLSPSLIGELATESIGSPHLMQDFCRSICRLKGITKTSIEHSTIDLNEEELKLIFQEMAESIGRPIFEKLARGPRQRTDRKPRALKNGEQVDIYRLVLHAMAHLKPGLVSLEYEQLRTAIKEISADDQIPTIQEVARVLKHMSDIATSDRSSTPVIDFDEGEKLLHITDPYFAFYLRWGVLDKEMSPSESA